MTASALLVVLGAALLMQEVGLSMAMGAFLAGVLLAESNFRHQLEADIEPFRGMLLGLFFMSVGMSIDVRCRARRIGCWLVAATLATSSSSRRRSSPSCSRLFGSHRWRRGLRSARCSRTAGEFAFVLLPLAGGLGLLTAAEAQLVTALAALTMLLAPIAATALDVALAPPPRRASRSPSPTTSPSAGGRAGPGRSASAGSGRSSIRSCCRRAST